MSLNADLIAAATVAAAVTEADRNASEAARLAAQAADFLTMAATVARDLPADWRSEGGATATLMLQLMRDDADAAAKFALQARARALRIDADAATITADDIEAGLDEIRSHLTATDYVVKTIIRYAGYLAA